MLRDAETRRRRLGALVAALMWSLAVSGYGFSGGTGEPNDPYQIATIEDLLSIGSSLTLTTKHFVLMNDLDLDPNLPGGRVFEDALIAPDQSESVSSHSGTRFTGVLDGRGHTIRNLAIGGRPGYDAGLFGMFSGLVKDLHLQDVRISGSPCGAIAGLNHEGMILRCSVTGQVVGDEDVGGMVGVLWDATLMDCRGEVQVSGVKDAGGLVGGGPGGTLIRCETQARVNGESHVGGLVGELGTLHVVESRARGAVAGADAAGGLAGRLATAGMVLRCASYCDVSGRTAGGLIGDARFARGMWIVDCYARGSLTFSASTVAGGLAGSAADMRAMNSYAACQTLPLWFEPDSASINLGGLYGQSHERSLPPVVGCFWDAQVARVNRGVGNVILNVGTGLDTAPMQQRATFEQAGWDFGSTWAMPEGEYPILQWELDRKSEDEEQGHAGI